MFRLRHGSIVDSGFWYILHCGQKGRSYGGHIAYGLSQNDDTFRVRFQVGSCLACDESIHFIDLYSPSIQLNRWYHLTATYDEVTGVGSLYINGQLVDSITRGAGLNYTDPSDPFGVGVTFVSDVSTPEGFWSGQLSQLRVFNSALSSTVVSDLYLGNGIIQSPSLEYDGYSSGSQHLDRSGLKSRCEQWSDRNRILSEEDLDGDGVPAFQDCDDSNAAISNSGTGVSASCSAESCKMTLYDGYSTGDGFY